MGSCAADSVSLYVVCNAVPEDNCSVTPDGDLCYAQGVLNLEYLADPQVNEGYTAALRVQSGLKPRTTEVPVQSEPNGMQVYEVEVEILDRAGNKPPLGVDLPNPYSVAVSSQHTLPGAVGLVGVELISPVYVQRLYDLEESGAGLGRLQLRVILRGRTDGQVEVESAPWNWVVDLVRINLRDTARCVETDEVICGLGQDLAANICIPQDAP